MVITMQDREAAEVLLQMGEMSRGLGGSGHHLQRKSVITNTRSALTQKEDPTPQVWKANTGTGTKNVSSPPSPSRSQVLHQHTIPAGSGGGGIVFMQKQSSKQGPPTLHVKNPLHKPFPPQSISSQPAADPHVPISFVQQRKEIMHPSKGNSSHHDPSTDKSTSSEPKLVQPLGTLAQLERKIHTFQPIIKPSSSSSSKKQTGSDPGGPNSSGGSQQQHHQHFTQYLPHLLQPYSGRPPQPHMMDSGVIRLINPGTQHSSTGLVLPVAGVGGAFIHVPLPSPSSLSPQQPVPILPSKSALNLNLGPLINKNNSPSSIVSSSLQNQTTGGTIIDITASSPNLLRNNLQIFNSNNSLSPSSILNSDPTSPEQILKKKLDIKAEKRSLRARVPLHKDASKDIEVDGFIIPREFWAKAFVQADICHAAGILFKALFSQEEIQKCTLRGRNGTSLLNLQKRSAIFHAVGWMKQKNQNPYSFDPAATLYHTHQLSHEEKMIIEKKVFVERRYQTSRKIRDYQRPKQRRQKLLLQLQQEELLRNPINTTLYESDPVYEHEPITKVEEIEVKPEPVDVDYYDYSNNTNMTYHSGQQSAPTSPPYIKKEPMDIDPEQANLSNTSFAGGGGDTPSSPKQAKLDINKK
ncbi:uncharacterized protein LOC110844372 isoform X2 [Folsomia candida]|nr:uncharacterized protein LOC110844372 isoform X2 [Folsomia candida]